MDFHSSRQAVRSLLKNKATSLLNIIGLSVAFALCLLSGIVLWDAYSSDSNWSGSDRIHKLQRFGYFGNNYRFTYSFPINSEEKLSSFSPSTESVTLPGWSNRKLIIDQTLVERNGAFIDKNFFTVFPMEAIEGSLEQAQLEAQTIILTKSMAESLYGSESAIGNVIEFITKEERTNFKVVAVVPTLPSNSDLHAYKFFIPIQQSTNAHSGQVFIKLKADFQDDSFWNSLETYIDTAFPLEARYKKGSYEIKTLEGDKFNQLINKRNDSTLIGLFGSALLMLLIAVSSYISMSTSMLSSRAKDIALRKIFGASKTSLLVSYFIEAILLTTLAFCSGLGLAALLMDYIGSMLGNDFQLFAKHRIPHLSIAWGISIAIGLLSALYPAFLISKNKAGTLLLSQQRTVAGGGGTLRSILIFFQFAIGLGLSFSAALIYYQLTSLQQNDMGFKADGLLYIQGETWGKNVNAKHDYLEKQLNQLPDILQTAQSSLTPLMRTGLNIARIIHPKSGDPVTQMNSLYKKGYFELLGIPLLAGRIPSANSKADTSEKKHTVYVVVNEKMMRKMGYDTPESMISTCLYTLPQPNAKPTDNQWCYEVAGVVADFQTSTYTKRPIDALMFVPSKSYTNHIFVRFKTENLSDLIQSIQSLWQENYPHLPFKYHFPDELLAEGYRTYSTMASLLLYTAITSLILTLAGLYSMARYVVVKKYREIAIRKVHGASTLEILKLLILQLLKPALPGTIVGLIAGWYFIQDWLTNFAIRIEPQIWMTFAAALFGLAFFLIAISSNAIKAIKIRPAEALHYE
ncbi:FtsX-like permease family protein [Temperatibacter marinus]|uniref:FtsX-like permease family protein n=1 Tax=Temperatibacter marinus TaxID=1456591 RepID=A0AA52EIR6_9PROT|nr:FtsX-like permease family protein [Temperatibacter marinus]WND03259.1 FtsX-like permease family protein [Temperatibacter marinus]